MGHLISSTKYLEEKLRNFIWKNKKVIVLHTDSEVAYSKTPNYIIISKPVPILKIPTKVMFIEFNSPVWIYRKIGFKY